MDGHPRQNPAYRPATEKALETGLFLCPDYRDRSYTRTSTPSGPTGFASVRRQFDFSLVSPNRRRPVPSTTGKTMRFSWSTRSASSTACTSRRLPGTWTMPSISSLSFAASSAASPRRTVVLFHSGSSSVDETTYFGIVLNLSANSPSREGQAPAKLSYVMRPISSASVSSVSSSLNWFPSSPRSNSKLQPGYLNSSPPGACITPSSDTNWVTTNLPICGSFSLLS